MEIRNLWPTPVATEHIALPEAMRQGLITVLVRRESESQETLEADPDFHRFMTSKKFYASTHYNLFAEADRHPESKAILAFEQVACNRFRHYLDAAYGMGADQDVELSGRCFGNVQQPGARTFPHYHQSSDGVMVHYLDVGDGRDPDAHRSKRHGTHALLLLDPRGTPNFPWWEKIDSITPRQGLTVIHPANVWHETNVWRGTGTRVCIVVNFQIIKPGYQSLHQPLRG